MGYIGGEGEGGGGGGWFISRGSNRLNVTVCMYTRVQGESIRMGGGGEGVNGSIRV